MLDCVGIRRDLDDVIPAVSSFEEKQNGESQWHLLQLDKFIPSASSCPS